MSELALKYGSIRRTNQIQDVESSDENLWEIGRTDIALAVSDRTNAVADTQFPAMKKIAICILAYDHSIKIVKAAA